MEGSLAQTYGDKFHKSVPRQRSMQEFDV
jgi:hypothetical protein